jgi:hypothetical protein
MSHYADISYFLKWRAFHSFPFFKKFASQKPRKKSGIKYGLSEISQGSFEMKIKKRPTYLPNVFEKFNGKKRNHRRIGILACSFPGRTDKNVYLTSRA